MAEDSVNSVASRCKQFVIIATVLLAGCGKSERGSVKGRVVRQDTTPVVGATVIARSAETGKWAKGTTDTNGNYELGGANAGDGIPPGAYSVVIMEDRGERAEKPRTISPKYEKPTTSGLELKVTEGQNTVFDITLDPS